MSEQKRDPRFFDGAGVILKSDGERGRILSWDQEDGDYLVLVPLDQNVHTPWLLPEDFEPDPDPVPWPGGDPPQGVICVSMNGRADDLEVFASIEQMNAGRQEGDANVLRNLALQAVADPGEWIRYGPDDVVLVSFQLLDQEEVNDDGGHRKA